jgi:hypothetical protein
MSSAQVPITATPALGHPAVEGKVVQGFQGFDVGDRVRVELVATNVERGFIDCAGPPS